MLCVLMSYFSWKLLFNCHNFFQKSAEKKSPKYLDHGLMFSKASHYLYHSLTKNLEPLTFHSVINYYQSLYSTALGVYVTDFLSNCVIFWPKNYTGLVKRHVVCIRKYCKSNTTTSRSFNSPIVARVESFQRKLAITVTL